MTEGEEKDCASRLPCRCTMSASASASDGASYMYAVVVDREKREGSKRGKREGEDDERRRWESGRGGKCLLVTSLLVVPDLSCLEIGG